MLGESSFIQSRESSFQFIFPMAQTMLTLIITWNIHTLFFFFFFFEELTGLKTGFVNKKMKLDSLKIFNNLLSVCFISERVSWISCCLPKLDRGLEVVSDAHFLDIFSRKIFHISRLQIATGNRLLPVICAF